MVKDRLIDNDEVKQLSFRERLYEKDIPLTKIKQLKEIGFQNQKKEIYEAVKDTFKIVQ